MFEDIPLWLLLIVIILPFVLAVILFTDLIDIFRSVFEKFKAKETVLLGDIGFILLFLIFFNTIINIVLYLASQQPEGFSIFTYLIEDTLPVVLYALTIYGILHNLQVLLSRGQRSDR